MVAGVGDHRVRGTEDRAERTEVGLMAGREHERGLGPEPLGELRLERQVQADRAVEKPRAGQSGAVLVERVQRALLDALVAGETEVVVGAEHDPRLALHLDDRERGTLEHPEVREHVVLLGGAEQLESFELPGLGEDVDRSGHVAFRPAWRSKSVPSHRKAT